MEDPTLDMRKRLVYISGALSDMDEAKREALRTFYEKIAEVCVGSHLAPYLPHTVSDPKRNASMSSTDVDQLDRRAVTSSSLVIAYVGHASLGVGIEIEMAYHANKPVILLFEKQALEARRISRLSRGNPAVVDEIVFTDFDDALGQLTEKLPTLLARLGESLPELLKPNELSKQ